MPNVKRVRDDVLVVGACLVIGVGMLVFAFVHQKIAPIEQPACYSHQCHAADMAFNCAVDNSICRYCTRIAENQCPSEEQN